MSRNGNKRSEVIVRVFQLLDALDYGDAVSRYTIDISKILNELEIENFIVSKYANEKVKDFRVEWNGNLSTNEGDIILIHFSGKSEIANKINKIKGIKILVYHNITPQNYFVGMELHFKHCEDGREQINDLVKYCDYFIADSVFNANELRKHGVNSVTVIPIVVDIPARFEKLQRNPTKKNIQFLFVGRVAPNKKHEDIVRIFDYYYRYIDNKASLQLVGNYNDYEPYYFKLKSFIGALPSRNQIKFYGKVSDEELDSIYRRSDVFISMSEHEGFCVPLVESMSYGLLTLAYDAGAIRNTMGGAGLLILDKRFEDIAELIDVIVNDDAIYKNIINKQYEMIEKYSHENSKKRLHELLTGDMLV
jgi:glycosyltransferase involved in cell wall biosynthesis